MTLTGVLILILLGIILVLIEIVLIPGIGIAGIVGALLILTAVFFAYELNTITGHLTFCGAFISGGLLTYLAFRSKTWERVSLKKEIRSKVETNEIDRIAINDSGKTISRLAPTGKALIKDTLYEVRSAGEYIEENKVIVITKIEGNTIFVKEKIEI